MSKRKQTEEERIQKRIEKAEKKALKYSGVDEGLVQRFWELVSMFPRITDPELEARIEHFTMNATADQYFRMQEALFGEATHYLLEDPRVQYAMEDIRGKQIGLAVEGEYESTVTLDRSGFKIERGIKENVPVISVASRRDYADAILRRKDPIKMIITRRIKASHKLRLLRWAFPHIDVLKEKGLFEKYYSYQPELEAVLDRTMSEMGY
jgi:hypothetical protein